MGLTTDDVEAALAAEAETDLNTDAMLATVIRRGRQRQRRVQLLGVVTATAAVVTGAVTVPPLLHWSGSRAATAGASQAAGPADAGALPTRAAFTGVCTVRPLPLPSGLAAVGSSTDDTMNVVDDISPSGMDPTGRYVVASVSEEAVHRTVVIRWDNGVPTVLPFADKDTVILTGGVNVHGTVVGGHLDPTGIDLPTGFHYPPGYAWVYQDGAVSRLPTPAGYDVATATAINSRGEIAGTANKFSGPTVAVVWANDAARTPRILTAPGGAGASGIADDGTVVGYAGQTRYGVGDDPEDRRPYAWSPDGTGRFLGLPTGEQVGMVNQVRGEWATGFTGHDGVVAGKGIELIAKTTVWNLSAGTESIVDGELRVRVGINPHGDLAYGSTDVRATDSVLVRDGHSYALTAPTPPDPRLEKHSTMPVAISDDATVILGRTNGWPGRPQPVVVWRC